ncbi:pirin family protein [Flavobacterium sp.]|uniref:pirin family protein n=1 Tax=Flavobacterium sp. TaxID=239 RepID=UPI0026058252|nr:pirin family protein [Flavobacterium sp.]
MALTIFPADQRGTADHGWLKANFSFSFGNYFNADNTQFGMLRVLNDDTIAPGVGFGTHPHDNMEIITIPLEGGLKHKDSMGNEGVIGFGEVQVMSAGSGVLHSEMNASTTETAKTLQLWVFTEKENVAPRYDQKSFALEDNKNRLLTVVSPHDKQSEGSLWVYQQTWFSLGIFEAGQEFNYELHHQNHGVYAFLIEGEIEIDGQKLHKRDAAGITQTAHFKIKTNSESKILLVEVPMS